MATSSMFRAFLLMTFAIYAVNAQSNTCDSSPESRGAECLHRQGEGYATAYCSSILSIDAPTATTTATLPGTSTFTRTKTIITDTVTSRVDTTTTSTSIAISYTCGTGNVTIPASGSPTGTWRNTTMATTHSRPSVGTISNPAGRPTGSISGSISYSSNWSITATRPSYITSSPAIPSYGAVKEKRQSVIFYTPLCFRKYSSEYGGAYITSACKCFAMATPVPVSTITSIVWATSTTTTLTESAVKTVNVTSTSTKISSSTITMASSTPTSFNIYYTDASSNSTNPPANFFKAITAPGGSGIVLVGEAAADSFALDSRRRLVDTTDGNAFIAKNDDDLYPFELLQTTAATKNTPICSACNSTLQCDYPGTTGNTFALCYGYLALGPPSVFGKDSNGDGHIDCTPIKLQFK